MWQFLLDFFFPKRSLAGREGEWITPAERSMLTSHPIILEEEDLRERGILSLDRLVAASSYARHQLLQKAIYRYKYHGVRSLGNDLGEILLQTSYLAWTANQHPMICPVPLHWSRKFSRGFNQALVLAEIVARGRVCEVCSLLRRTRPTGHQAWRERSERLSAVRGAFTARSSSLPRKIILIDDIATTGATLDACALALKRAGVERVEGLVLALG